MIKGLIKLLPENTNLGGINYFEYEGLLGGRSDESDTNDFVVRFPLTRTKKNNDNYDASLFHVITRTSNHPWVYNDISLYYRYYTISKRLELALSYANDSNDWGDAVEINLNDLEEEETDFIRNWFIGQAEEGVTKAANTYGLTDDDYIGSGYDMLGVQRLTRWYSKENKCFKLTKDNIFDLNNQLKIECVVYHKDKVVFY